MKRCFAMLTAFCVTLLALPLISAQDAEKKDKDVEKKDAAKKDEAKKEDAKKDEAKKDDAKKDGKDEPKKKEGDDEPKKESKSGSKSKGPEEPKLVHGAVLQGVKLTAIDSAESRAFTVQVMAPDPAKMAQNQLWQMQQMASMQQTRLTNPQQYMINMRNFQMQMMQRQAQAYSPKDVRLKAEEGCKVRVMFPAAEYDDKGNLKKWTKKELDALKGNSKLPGYPAEFDALRQGQYVTVYLAPPPKGAEKKIASGPPMKKKAPADDDDAGAAMPADRQDVVMIVIVADPPMGK